MVVYLVLSVVFGYIYEDADSLIVYNDSLVICGFHHYNYKVHIGDHGKLEIRDWNMTVDSTGWLQLNAPLITVQDSSLIEGSAAGCQGGYLENHPYGYGPGYGGGGTSGAGGGAGYGGIGGKGGDFMPGMGGSVYGNASDTIIDLGSGGGAGQLSFIDGIGGNGGGSVRLRAQKIEIDASSILVDGQRGGNGSLEAGGGGSGGGIMIWADTVLIHNSLILANAGNGGDATWGAGGGGGGGRIKIFYASLIDTSGLYTAADGGGAGYGYYGNPEPGMSGSIHIGPDVQVDENVATKEPILVVGPNPIRNRITIAVKDPPVIVFLCDITGRVMKTVQLENELEYVELEKLPTGTYFLGTVGEIGSFIKIVLLK